VIELAALDMAGTTIDERGAVYRALAESVEAEGVRLTHEAVQRWMGTDKREAMRGLVTEAGGPPPAAADVERMYARFRDLLAKAYADQPPVPVAGAPEAFAALRAAGVRVALTTGFAHDVADPLLASLGWDDGVVDAVVCIDDVPAGRPAPDLIFRAMALTGVRDAARVLIAGDTVVDLRAGMNARAAVVVGVGTGKLSLAELAAEPHTHLLASVADLPALVASLAPS
jgi:phosphonatase-like hydrolase